jgi:hypothetical protein
MRKVSFESSHLYSSSNWKSKGRDDIRTEHVCMYMRLCGSCYSPSSQGLYKTKQNIKQIIPYGISKECAVI